MTEIVVDASVAVKWFLPEPHAEAARRVFNGGRVLLAPDLIWAEVGNVLWKRCRRAELAPESARQILREFRQFPIETYTAKSLADPAWELAQKLGVTMYDGLYLALAISRDCRLVTADRQFYDALQKGSLGPIVRWVEQP